MDPLGGAPVGSQDGADDGAARLSISTPAPSSRRRSSTSGSHHHRRSHRNSLTSASHISSPTTSPAMGRRLTLSDPFSGQKMDGPLSSIDALLDLAPVSLEPPPPAPVSHHRDGAGEEEMRRMAAVPAPQQPRRRHRSVIVDPSEHKRRKKKTHSKGRSSSAKGRRARSASTNSPARRGRSEDSKSKKQRRRRKDGGGSRNPSRASTGQRTQRRHRRRHGGSSSRNERSGISPAGSEDEEESSEPTYRPLWEEDYNPDDPEALEARMRALEAEMAGAAADDGSMELSSFECGPMPYWIHRLSDVLLFQNTSSISPGSGQLPVDTVVAMLRADIKGLRQLIDQVKAGNDGGRWGTKPAKKMEVYGAKKREGGLQSPATDPGLLSPASQLDASTTAAVVVLSSSTPRGSFDDGSDEVDDVDDDEDDLCPLLSPMEEEEDQQRPILDRLVPLWRRKGAAMESLITLADFLEDRLHVLQRRLCSPTDGLDFSLIGAPSSSGVDGRQRATMPPAIEHAFAATITRALLSDMFLHPSSAFRNRAARLSRAFDLQTPHVLNHFVIEENCRPQYDFRKVRDASLFSANVGEFESAKTTAYRSYSIHIDYIRFHPFAQAGKATSANPVDFLSSVRQNSLGRLLLNGSVANLGMSMANAAPLDELLLQFPLLMSMATDAQSLLPFSPEECLIAVLMEHYERYRLLAMNLLPFLKSRTFYEDQIQHLQQQQHRTQDVDQLEDELRVLASRSRDLERTCMTAMITVWKLVLRVRRLRGEEAEAEAELPFSVTNQEQARALERMMRRRAQPAMDGCAVTPLRVRRMTQQDEGLAISPRSPERHTIRRFDVFDSDESNTNSDAVPDNFSSSSDSAGVLSAASDPFLVNSIIDPSSPALEDGQDASVLLQSSAGQGEMARERQRPRRFHFFLCRYGHQQETPYVEGEDVLKYSPVVEGADIPASILTPEHTSNAAADALGHRGSGGPTVAVPILTNAVHFDAGESVDDDDDVQTPVEEMRFFQVVVFARSNAAMPPQYVGCSLPRPITTARLVFFNETFEIRTKLQPAEILLHVIAVTDGPGRGNVVATVRVEPTLTRQYRLLPLQPPISFFYRGKVIGRYLNSNLSGVISTSTTWTSFDGLSMEDMEHLFLSGTADPRDPQYLPLLRVLRSYYVERDRTEEIAAAARTRERRRREHALKKGTNLSRSRYHRKSELDHRLLHPSSHAEADDLPADHNTAALTDLLLRTDIVEKDNELNGIIRNQLFHLDRRVVGSSSFFRSKRLRLLRRRWLTVSGQVKVESQVEDRLFQLPIPLGEMAGHDLFRRVRREITRNDDERNKEYEYGNTSFDVKRYYAEPTAISGLALTPLSNETKRKLWQERQRRMKLTNRRVRIATDEQLLERYVTVPKFNLKLVLDLTPRSQLNPRRDERPKTEEIDLELLQRRQDSRIQIHIMKAHHLPERMDGTPLEPFVQATFVCETGYSRSEVGSSPSWFQSLELPFQPLDFSEETLNLIDDDIIISVYDKVQIALPSKAMLTTGAVAHETHFRTERRFLGSVRIPFFALHQADEARIEGVYPLHTPRWLLGYIPDRDGLETEEGDQGGGGGEATNSLANPFHTATTPSNSVYSDDFGSFAYPKPSGAIGGGGGGGAALATGYNREPTLQLYISLWPPLQRGKPEKLKEEVWIRLVRELNVSDGLRYLHHCALKWRKTMARKFRSIGRANPHAIHREVSPFVFCSTGDLVLACRYLRPHGGPPPSTVTTVMEAIRYVSLVPFTLDIMKWVERDVWNTNVELLSMRSGDCLELGLLLAHFLRYLAPNYPTYVVVGTSLTYHRTQCVLHAFEGQHWRLINPHNGHISSLESPNGTNLRDVEMILSDCQAWANVQVSGQPHRMSWDLSHKAYWNPCFDLRRDPLMVHARRVMEPIQREVLALNAPEAATTRGLEVELRDALRRALLAWRNHRPPAYHRGVESILREVLVCAEEERCTFGSERLPHITQRALDKLREYLGESVRGVSATHNHKRSRPATQHFFASSSHAPTNVHQSVLTETSAINNNNMSVEQQRAQTSTRLVRGREVPCLHLVGSPVSLSYNPADKTFHEILQKVYEQAVHEVGTDDVSFAAGIYVKGYTTNVYAMWVFLVAICRGVSFEDS